MRFPNYVQKALAEILELKCYNERKGIKKQDWKIEILMKLTGIHNGKFWRHSKSAILTGQGDENNKK